MNKSKLTEPYPLIHPNPIVLVGTLLDQQVNFTTIGDVAVAGIHPPLVMISCKESHQATRTIFATKRFSINVPTQEMMALADYCGVHSGKDTDKSVLVEHEIKGPYVAATKAPVTLFCEVLHSHQIDRRVIMIAAVKETWIAHELIDHGTLELGSLKALVYGLDNRYYTVSEPIGVGYEAFKHLPLNE